MIRTKYPKKEKKVKKEKKKTLSAKQLKFVELFLADNNLYDYECYMQAYPRIKKKEYAAVSACNLLKKPHVKEYIDEIREAVKEKTKITQEQAVLGYERIAKFDHRKLYDKDKKPLHIADLDDDTAMGLHSIEFSTYQVKKKIKGKTKVQTKVYLKNIKTEGRKAAWDSICNLLGFNKENEGTAEDFVKDVRGFAENINEAIPGGEI